MEWEKSEIIDAGVGRTSAVARLLLLLSKLDQREIVRRSPRLPPATIKFQLGFDAFSMHSWLEQRKRNENFKKSLERSLIFYFDSDKQITR